MPLDPQTPAGATINLAVTVRRANPTRWTSPILALLGPLTAVNWADPSILADGLVGHDLIAIDARGLGRSDGTADCPKLKGYTAELNTLNLQPDAVAAVKACLAKAATTPVPLSSVLDHGVVAADIVRIRRALGIETWGLYTTLGSADVALHLLAVDAPAVTAVIARDPFAVGAAQSPNSVAEAFDRLAADCAAAPDCARNGDLRQGLAALVARPPVATGVKEKTTGWPIVLDGLAAQFGLTYAMREPTLAGVVPTIVTAPAAPAADDATARLFDTLPASGDAVLISLFCQDLGYMSPALVGAADDHGAAFRGMSAKRLCDLIGPVPQMTAPPKVAGTVPVLVVLSSYDTRSSETIARSVFGGFTHLVIVTAQGQPNAMVNRACFLETTAAFADAPTSPVDTTCLTKPDHVTFT